MEFYLHEVMSRSSIHVRNAQGITITNCDVTTWSWVILVNPIYWHTGAFDPPTHYDTILCMHNTREPVTFKFTGYSWGRGSLSSPNSCGDVTVVPCALRARIEDPDTTS